MLFSSPIFLFIFLPFVLAGYRLLKECYRVYFLMLASLFFYAWGGPKHILTMLLSIAINYSFGLLIHISDGKKARKTFLWFAVACNVGILVYYKYLNFIISTFCDVFSIETINSNIIMPIGISFFTFQGMSYVIDLYFEKVEVQKNPAVMAFYISFFPQLIAGPIVRYVDIVGQIYSRKDTLEKFVDGAKRFIVGLAKKIIIANTLGSTVDQIFANPAVENTAATAWLGVISYSFQIFYDFSGYSDMAVGLGKMFGFDFVENFNYPYLAKSATEFWRRWHISLSTWFRDYVYIPLGGNRTGNVYVNLLIVFVITGFWHGASFNFLIWGLWHGLFLIVERMVRPFTPLKKIALIYYIISHLYTISIIVIGWVFFRTDGLGDAVAYLGVMFGAVRPEHAGFTAWYYINTKFLLALSIALVCLFPVPRVGLFVSIRRGLMGKYVSNMLILLLFLVSIVFVVSSSYNPFIYFRF